jgi:hypothetical protein
MDWQPIDTAPKDGTSILGFISDGAMAVVEFVKASDGSCGWEMFHENLPDRTRGYFCALTLTHWQPLPPPPATTPKDRPDE